jgi:hypothetical protein
MKGQQSPRIEFPVHFRTGQNGLKQLKEGTLRKAVNQTEKDLPRLTRLLALAHRWNRLIEEGVVADRAEIARTMGLSRARVTQIMDLMYLAPEIQEEILFGVFQRLVPEHSVRALLRIQDWMKQLKAWLDLGS